MFDGQGTIDWPSVKRSGVEFALIKATQGTYDTQATFARNWRGAKDAGVLRGAYHFFDPTEDGAGQAQHFLSALSAASMGDGGLAQALTDLPPVLDIECPDGSRDCLGTGAPGQAQAPEISKRMWSFLRAVAAGSGRTPIVYT
ncbi:MAG: glycoside hydrolase family 25 protein, partial [Polyangiaceae bacterium]